MKGKATVHKLDAAGNELWRYEGQVLDSSPTSVTLEARYDKPDEDFHGLLLRQGDRFVETHYADRWYNVFAVHDADSGELKGWYCNITRPASLEDGRISAVDLALDLIVFPGGRWVLLDEDEFARLQISAEDRRQARRALEELIQAAETGREPFGGSG